MFKKIKSVLFKNYKAKHLAGNYPEEIKEVKKSPTLKLEGFDVPYIKVDLPIPDSSLFESFSFTNALRDFTFSYNRFVTVEDNFPVGGVVQCDLRESFLRVAVIDTQAMARINTPVLVLDVVTESGNPRKVLEIKDIRVTSYHSLPKMRQLQYKHYREVVK